MHPYKSLREEWNISQAELAAVAGVSPQVVMRIEQGMYATPSVKVVSALVDLGSARGQNLNSSILLEQHGTWIKRERAANGLLIKEVARNWPYKGSIAGLARILCVQLSVMQKWGMKGNPPPQIKEAFRDGGVAEDVLARIN